MILNIETFLVVQHCIVSDQERIMIYKLLLEMYKEVLSELLSEMKDIYDIYDTDDGIISSHSLLQAILHYLYIQEKRRSSSTVLKVFQGYILQ
ncbi:hypothetical protein GDO81_015520 [Engystomops pustulosus]|uniref:Uncharacterized protein n=1 Tax=Engystomops pustulosus TaxID=76066 RepID=A0AAV7AUW3_ENGPU|nr:hypothetical protein GDO81_015520 [Engystomops pustulosus]